MKKYLTVIVCLASATLFAQKLKIQDGGFDFLEGQKEINVEFVYDNMQLLKKNLSEEEYVKEHTTELEEKSPGKGESWKKIGKPHVILFGNPSSWSS